MSSITKACCSCCLLDAIFISDCGQFKACPKHYFSYKTQGYKLKRIKIPINEESKEILFNFIVTLKNEFNARKEYLIEESINNEDNKKYKEKLKWANEAFHDCSIIVMHLLRKQFILAKIILSPFEYFLTQPKEKAQQYTKQNWNRNDLLEFCRSFKGHVFDFNYFKFENQKFIHGWTYKSTYNQHDRLSDFFGTVFLDFIKISEYEMAYELYRNLKSYKEFYDSSSIQKIERTIVLFGKILKNKTKNKKIDSQLNKQWKQLPKTLSIKNPPDKSAKNLVENSSENLAFFAYLALNQLLFMMSIDTNVSDYFLRILMFVQENYSQYYSKHVSNRINQELGLLYYGDKNYSEAIECFNKSIKYHKKRLQKDSWQNKAGIWDDSLEYLIEAYLCLAKAYCALKNNKEIIEILKLVEIECSRTKDKFLPHATIGEIYYLLNDFDQAYKKIWKCIKISKEKEFINSYELSNLLLLLADIHVWRGDFKKAHQSLYIAESFFSILPIADPSEQEIYKAFGVFYLNRQWYDDALIYFEKITNRWSSHELLFAKFSMGIAYFWKLDYQKALEFLNEAKEMMSGFTESYKNQLFIANAYIGELCQFGGDLENADTYFKEAFELIDHYDIFKNDIYLKSSSFAFSYFYKKSSYEKCETILHRINKILENNAHLKFRMPLYFIQLVELFMARNQMEKAEKSLREAENLLNANKILFSAQKNIKINDLDCISDYIELAQVYISLFDAFDKAEKILKYSEEVVNAKRLNDRFSKLSIYYWLGDLYFKQQRWEESRNYSQLSLDLHKEFNHNSDAVRDLNQKLIAIDEILEIYG
ncbi:unnamed protein product [Blepharisma stoltei]|uniref:Tetratricopeptide repeat protein n=1 Tax=Blepharisma stoltei TaxID=1481888 RepID=A0AAU9JGI2_9CILI|nr:unnamed protein product [Blepharisma stoltei]